MSDKKIIFDGKEINLSEIIAKQLYSPEDAQKALNKLYVEVESTTIPFGTMVENILIAQGITKKWGKRVIVDVSKASMLTGLNPNIFRTNMYKPNCTVDMGLVISIAIGLKISTVLMQELLAAAGLKFRLENPEHIAYIFLLEHCRDYSIEQCNEILEYLGVPKTKRLGSYGRGNAGESGYYSSRNNS